MLQNLLEPIRSALLEIFASTHLPLIHQDTDVANRLVFAYTQEHSTHVGHDIGRIKASNGQFKNPYDTNWRRTAFLPSTRASTSLYHRIIEIIKRQKADGVYILVHGANRSLPHIRMLEEMSYAAPVYLIPVGREQIQNRDASVLYCVTGDITQSQWNTNIAYPKVYCKDIDNRKVINAITAQIHHRSPLINPIRVQETCQYPVRSRPLV